jgi:PAS domain S-box-containing protein
MTQESVPPLRILLVEDDPADARLVRWAFEQSAALEVLLTWTPTFSDGLRALAGHAFDAVLLDLRLPDAHGAPMVRELLDRHPHVPVIVLSGPAEDEAALEAVRLGAQDYVPKAAIDSGLLERSVRYATERQALRLALARKAEEAKRILNAVPDVVAVVAPDGRLVGWNPRLERATGYSPEELQRLYLPQLTSPSCAVGLWEPGPAAAEADTVRLESDLVPKNGAHAPYLWGGAPLLTGDGVVTGLVAIGKDLGDLRRAEATQAEQAREIERLHEASRFKSDFLNTIAHELRTPLTPVCVHLYTLSRSLKESLTPDQRRSFAMLEHSVQRMVRMIDDALDAVRLQAGRLSLRPKATDLAQLARQALDTFADSAREAGIELQGCLVQDLPVHADPTRIEQVLDNLMSNALKYTPRGGVVTVVGQIEDGEAVVRVQDTGIGLDAEQRGRLFKPFSRVHDPAKVTAPGHGLGLYIIHGILQGHGGRLECESPGPGQGSTFTMALPLLAAQEPAALALAPVPHAATNPRHPLP